MVRVARILIHRIRLKIRSNIEKLSLVENLLTINRGNVLTLKFPSWDFVTFLSSRNVSLWTNKSDLGTPRFCKKNILVKMLDNSIYIFKE